MNMKATVLAILLCSGQPIAADNAPQRATSAILRQVSYYSVRVRRDNPKSPAVGSGTIIPSKKGTVILTCAHVVGTETAMIVDIDEEGKDVKSLPALVEKVDEKLDLAIIRVLGDSKLPPAVTAQGEPALYDELYVVGSPVSVMRQSSILRLNTKDAMYPGMLGHVLWTVSGSMVPGMSGAGVFNANGELVAVVKSCLILQVSEKQTQVLTTGGFVIALSDIRNFIKGL